ncbi:MAG: heavy metal-binding domain-containing protein [Chitinophagales bacterium]
MKTKAILSLIIFLFVGMHFSACSNSGKENNTTQQTVEGDKWMCPMKCEGDLLHDNPGNCAICGMELKKVEE